MSENTRTKKKSAQCEVAGDRFNIGRYLATRQELIPSTALASLSIGDNRSMWIPQGSEILRLYAYLHPAPGTIPEMRLDLFGLPVHRCNLLEIPFSEHPIPKIDHRLTSPFNTIKHLRSEANLHPMGTTPHAKRP